MKSLPETYLKDCDMGFGKESEIQDALKDKYASRYEKQDSQLPGLKYGIIEVTSKCQLECPGCYMVTRNVLNNGDMPLERAKRILDLCKEYCGQELETMDILGGEPLLWPYLKDFVTELIKRGIKPWIFTNMLAITPELAKWLYENQVYITGKLNVDPTDESNLPLQAEMIGRDEKSARKMIDAICVFKKAGYKTPLFRLQNLVRKNNIDLVPGYYKWCIENDIGTDLELMGCGEGAGPAYWEIAPTSIQLAEMIKKIQTVRQQLELAPLEILMPHIFGSCPFFDKGLYFDINGNIRSCSNSTVQLGNINEPNAVKKAYESFLIKTRCSLSKENVGQPCGSCEKWEKCRGGCRATVEGNGDPFGGYELCPVPYLKS